MKHSFETFRFLTDFDFDRLTEKEPYCFNGEVAVRKYRVTVEHVDEPDSVLRERLQKLWDKCDNHHLWRPLQSAAKELGMNLTHVQKSRKKP